MKAVHVIAFILLVVGGLNWLLVGLAMWDIGELFGGQSALVSRVIYVLVGLSALYMLLMHRKACMSCDTKGGGSSAPASNPASGPMA